MIGYIEGSVKKIEERSLILVAGGVGYRVFATNQLLGEVSLGDQVEVWTYLAVREDAMDLYGFRDEREQTMFESLLRVSGIGPKSAMNILSSTGVDLLYRSIAGNDASYLTKVSGVGKKTAEKIVLELHDKIPQLTNQEATSTGEHEALDALEALGYPIRETKEIVRMITATERDVGTIIKLALKQLGK